MNYQQAFQRACEQVIATGRDYGIEKNAFGFAVFMLPRPENRFGHELRCEVVTPLIARAMTMKAVT